MGVAGSGKTTVGRTLAKELNWIFYDVDDFHTPESIEKMVKSIQCIFDMTPSCVQTKTWH